MKDSLPLDCVGGYDAPIVRHFESPQGGNAMNHVASGAPTSGR